MLLVLLLTLASVLSIGGIVAGATLIVRSYRSRTWPGHCAHCGYLTRGLPAVQRCPECGQPPQRPVRLFGSAPPYRVQLVAGLACLIGGFALPIALLSLPRLGAAAAVVVMPPAPPLVFAPRSTAVARPVLQKLTVPELGDLVDFGMPPVGRDGLVISEGALTDLDEIMAAWSVAGLELLPGTAASETGEAEPSSPIDDPRSPLKRLLEQPPDRSVVGPRNIDRSTPAAPIRRTAPASTRPLFPR